MKKTRDMIKVMQAFENGAEIECALNFYANKIWKDTSNPAWEWHQFDYRVKQAPEYIPFTFEDAEFLIGKAIKKDGGHVYSILGVKDSGVTVIHPIYKIVSYTWEDLMLSFKFFPSGSPCGKLKQQ